MRLPHRIKLDIDQEYYNLIPAQQGDTARVLNFQILNNNIPFSLENKTVRARIKKPDGNVCYNDMEIINASAGECDLKLTNQILIKPGMCKVQLEIMENGEILSTIIFAIFIRESIDVKDAAESTNEFTALENGIIKLDEWDKYFKETSGAIEEKYTERLNGIDSSLEESNIKISNLSIGKVDKISGKGLSTYDYDNLEKTEVSKVKSKADISYVDTKFAGISSGTPLFASSVEGMTDTTRNYVNITDGYLYTYNGSKFIKSTVKYQATGIQNNSITPLQTNFINLYNLFNKDDVLEYKWIDDSGNIADASLSWTSNKIYIEAGKTYYFSKIDGGIPAYTGDDAFIKKMPVISVNDKLDSVTLAPDTTAKYIRVYCKYSKCTPDKFYFGESQNINTKMYEINGNIKVNVDSLDVNIYDTDLTKVSYTNLFDSESCVDGYIDINTGNVIDSTAHYTSDFYPLTEGNLYCFNVLNKLSYALYDESKNFIPNSGKNEIGTFLAKSGEKYIRFSQRYSIVPKDKFAFTKGDESIFYRYILNSDKLRAIEKLDGKGVFNLKRFPRLSTETDDTGRFIRALRCAKDGVVLVEDGDYYVSSQIVIKNRTSLILSQNARIIAKSQMNYIFYWDGGSQYTNLVVYNDDGTIYTKNNHMIMGGILEGNGLSSCLCVNNYKHFTIDNIQLNNGKYYGLRVGEIGHGYELIAKNIYGKVTMSGIEGNTFIRTDESDSHYIDCIGVDYTRGVYCKGHSNRFDRCHIWGGVIRSSLNNSVNFEVEGGSNVFNVCYADTGTIGFKISGSCRLLGCSFFNNYSTFGLDNVTYIKNTNNSKIFVTGCEFVSTAPNTAIYDGGENGVFKNNFINNSFVENGTI